MTDIYFIGIDPGKTGAIAVMDEEGKVLGVLPLPVKPAADQTKTYHGKARKDKDPKRIEIDLPMLNYRLNNLISDTTYKYIISLENAAATFMQNEGATSIATRCVNYGLLKAILLQLETLALYSVKLEILQPSAWSRYGLFKGYKFKNPNAKKKSIEWCQTFHPNAQIVMKGCRKPHDGVTDAICICEWGRRIYMEGKE